jgi:hypothetical protein
MFILDTNVVSELVALKESIRTSGHGRRTGGVYPSREFISVRHNRVRTR